MADKAIDDLGRDQMEFAEEVRILFEKESKKEKKNPHFYSSVQFFFLQFSFNFCHANSFFILHFLKKVNTD